MEFRKLKSLGPKIVRILHLQVSQELSQLSKFLHFICTRTNSYGRLCCVIVWAAISSEALPVYQPGTPGAGQRNAMWWRSGQGAVLQIFDHLKYLIILTIPHLCRNVLPRNLWRYHLGYLHQKSQALGHWGVMLIAKNVLGQNVQ